jgi:AraC-like DNA-binding protein
MILLDLPDHTRADFNIDAPCPVDGWPNMIIHARARESAWPMHRGPLSIKCAFGGREIYQTREERYPVDDNSYLVLNEGQEYSSTIEEPHEIESFCIFFRADFVDSTLGALVTPADRLLDDPIEPTTQPVRFFERLYPHDRIVTPHLLALRTATAAGVTTQGWIDEQFHELLERLLLVHRDVCRQIEALPAARRSTRLEIYRRLQRAREFMDAGLTEQLTIPQIAAIACLSPHHFLRLFKRVVGETPHQYLTRKRLERAQQLLLGSTRSVMDICFDVGFESPGSFSTLFRRHLGHSPDQFRLLHSASAKKAISEK